MRLLCKGFFFKKATKEQRMMTGIENIQHSHKNTFVSSKDINQYRTKSKKILDQKNLMRSVTNKTI